VHHPSKEADMRAKWLKAGLAGAAALALAATAHAETREFYIVTVHLDAKTNPVADAMHPAEPFPANPFPSTSGMWVKGPQENGDWTVRAFVFNPSQVVVMQGDEVVLHFVGVQGAAHTIAVKGVPEPVKFTRGTTATVKFTADKPGIVDFASTVLTPSMRGQVIVLPKN
jgi:plastocyanin